MSPIIKGAPTRYEIVAFSVVSGATHTVGYAENKSLAAFRCAVIANAQRLHAAIGCNKITPAGSPFGSEAKTDNGWGIKFSGRTERQAVKQNEAERGAL